MTTLPVVCYFAAAAMLSRVVVVDSELLLSSSQDVSAQILRSCDASFDVGGKNWQMAAECPQGFPVSSETIWQSRKTEKERKSHRGKCL
jgi:hypothetical protein